MASNLPQRFKIMSRYLAFTRRAAQSQRQALRAMQPAVTAYRKHLLALNSLDQLILETPDDAMITAYATGLSSIILSAYVNGIKTARKSPKRNQAAARLHSSTPALQILADKPDVDAFLQEYLSIDWNLPRSQAIRSLTDEAFSYANVSLGKLLNEIKDDALTALESGLSFADWKEQMQLTGFENANPFHLRTNFDTAANGSYHAAKWREIEDNRELFPYLRYVTMEDELVRDEHIILQNTVLPIDDPFWSIYYPPNGYNCRCSVEQLMLSEAEADPNYGNSPLTPELDPRFAKNSGQTGTIFS